METTSERPPLTIGDALAAPALDDFVLLRAGGGEDVAAGVARALEGLAREEAGGRAASRGWWISGPPGSGKSTLVTRLVAALEDVALPDGTRASEALTRAAKPRSTVLESSLGAALARRPVVVFTALGRGARARPPEAAVLSAVERRLGYSANGAVAEVERALEVAGRYDAFRAAVAAAGTPSWERVKDGPDAVQRCSAALHAIDARRYPEPSSFTERQRQREPQSPTARATADAIAAMMRAREPSSQLLVLILDGAGDIERDALRPLAANLLLRGRGRVAVIATGEQELDDGGGALDTCFPEALRLRLGPALQAAIARAQVLRKTATAEALVRERCEATSRAGSSIEDVVALYPLHPEVFGLLVRVVSALRRERGAAEPAPDAGEERRALPGPIDLARALVSRSDVRERPFPALIPIDDAFDALRPALDEERARAAERAFGVERASLRARATRAIAILEPLQPDVVTSIELLGRVLRDDLERAVDNSTLASALAGLVREGVATYGPAHGYALVTPAVEEWEAAREAVPISDEEVSQLVHEKLIALLDPSLKRALSGRAMRLRALYADGRRAHDEPLLERGEGPPFTLDMRHLPLYRRTGEEWAARTQRGNLLSRLVWVAQGDLQAVRAAGIDLARSRHHLRARAPVMGAAPEPTRRLLERERARREELERAMLDAVESTFVAGTFFCRGEALPARSLGASFGEALSGAIAAVAPRLTQEVIAPVITTPSPAPDPERDASTAEEREASGAPGDVTITLPRGRSIQTEEELEALLVDIERRAREALARGGKVTIG